MIEIIPAIDIIEGKCVRLTQGDYAQKSVYSDDPVRIAMDYKEAGVRRLHLVDLDGAKASAPVNLAVLERIAATTGLDIQYGGGIKSRESLKAVFDSGARRAICGSIAVTQPELLRGWLAEFGGGHIILGADIRDGFIATHGWLEGSAVGVEELIHGFTGDGLAQVICTDISRDGMLSGPNIPLYVGLQTSFPGIDITVSGGISSMEDIAALDGRGLRSVIVGKAIYEKRITMEQIAGFISGRDVIKR